MTTETRTGRDAFQDHMPGNVCFGCGRDNHEGLRISSHWEGDVAVCRWRPEPRYDGWRGLVNGGIIATLIDCHCMCTAMAHAVRREGRSLDSQPYYRFATGQITVRYVAPTPSNRLLELRARVVSVKDGRKYGLECEVWSGEESGGTMTARSEVVAFLVFSSDNPDHGASPFAGMA
jgi:acyl-coenzyme A thioesterase PaaI-like protein